MISPTRPSDPPHAPHDYPAAPQGSSGSVEPTSAFWWKLAGLMVALLTGVIGPALYIGATYASRVNDRLTRIEVGMSAQDRRVDVVKLRARLTALEIRATALAGRVLTLERDNDNSRDGRRRRRRR